MVYGEDGGYCWLGIVVPLHVQHKANKQSPSPLGERGWGEGETLSASRFQLAPCALPLTQAVRFAGLTAPYGLGRDWVGCGELHEPHRCCWEGDGVSKPNAAVSHPSNLVFDFEVLTQKG